MATHRKQQIAVTSSSVDATTDGKSTPLFATPQGRLKAILGLAAAGLLSLILVNQIIDSNHDNRVNPALENAEMMAANYSYSDVYSAWENLLVNNEDGSQNGVFDDLFWIGENITPSTVSNPKQTMLLGYDVETFARVSCIVVGFNPDGTEIGVSPGRCGTVALPNNVQDLVLG